MIFYLLLLIFAPIWVTFLYVALRIVYYCIVMVAILPWLAIYCHLRNKDFNEYAKIVLLENEEGEWKF